MPRSIAVSGPLRSRDFLLTLATALFSGSPPLPRDWRACERDPCERSSLAHQGARWEEKKRRRPGGTPEGERGEGERRLPKSTLQAARRSGKLPRPYIPGGRDGQACR